MRGGGRGRGKGRRGRKKRKEIEAQRAERGKEGNGKVWDRDTKETNLKDDGACALSLSLSSAHLAFEEIISDSCSGPHV